MSSFLARVAVAECEILGGPLIAMELIKKVIEAVKGALKKGRDEPDLEKLNKFIKKNSPGDLKDFADSAIKYFKDGKLDWDDFGVLQSEYPPGLEVIPWTYLKRQLKYAPWVENRMPKAFVQKVQACVDEGNSCTL